MKKKNKKRYEEIEYKLRNPKNKPRADKLKLLTPSPKHPCSALIENYAKDYF